MKKRISLYIFIILSFIISANEKVEVHFSLREDVANIIIDNINQAQKSLYFAVYSLTDINICEAIVEAKKRGVKIEGVTEEKNLKSKGAKFFYLKKNDIDIFLDDNPSLMHHKFVVIDENKVLTGSYNWTSSANNRNNENLIIINDKEISKKFLKEFKKVFWKAKLK